MVTRIQHRPYFPEITENVNTKKEFTNFARKLISEANTPKKIADAQFRLAGLYYFGLLRPGLNSNKNEIIRKLFESAAIGGNKSAQFKMGELYFKGDQVPQNIDEAIRWFKMTGLSVEKIVKNLEIDLKDREIFELAIRMDDPQVIALINKLPPKDLNIRIYIDGDYTYPLLLLLESQLEEEASALIEKLHPDDLIQYISPLTASLHFCSENISEQLILKMDAELLAKEESLGLTHLQKAIQVAKPLAARAILDRIRHTHNSTLSHQDPSGNTALHMATGQGMLQLAIEISQSMRIADFALRNSKGITPLTAAVNRGQTEVVETILQRLLAHYSDQEEFSIPKLIDLYFPLNDPKNRVNELMNLAKSSPLGSQLVLKAAELGHPTAQYIRGIYHHHNNSWDQPTPPIANCHGSVQFVHESSSETYAHESIIDLTPSGFNEAIHWYKDAAENGCFQAQKYVASLYYEGSGVEKDWGKAVELYSKTAEHEDAQSLFRLGIIYLEGGFGVEKDQKLALEYLEEAAFYGDAEAQSLLKSILYNYSGVT